MHSNVHFRGKLYSAAASLLLSLSGELLKWQFPVAAAGEKLALLAAVLRSACLPPAPELLRR
ncbi:MAG: hypothetical protein WBL63_09155 [Candidatus Acidiferrum sp.]